MTSRTFMNSILVIAAVTGFLPAPAVAQPRQSGFENYELKTEYFVSFQRRAPDGDLDHHNLGPYEKKPLAERVANAYRKDKRNRYVSVWSATKKIPIRGPHAVPNDAPISRFARNRLPGSAIRKPSVPPTSSAMYTRYVDRTVYYVVYDWRHLNGDRGTSQLGPYDTQEAAQQVASGLRGGTTVIYSNIRVISRVIRVPVGLRPDAIRKSNSYSSLNPQPLPPRNPIPKRRAFGFKRN